MTIETRGPNARTTASPASVFGHSSLIRHSSFDIRAWPRRGLLLTACGLWLLLAACEVRPSEQFKPQLVVHSLVEAGHVYTYANINRTYTIDEPFDSIFADVNCVIWRRADTWGLVHYRRDIFYSEQVHPNPAYGDTFGIRVAKDGFDTVYGQTVVPDSFRILFPRNGDTVTMSDSMVWTRSRNCAGYYMSFQSFLETGDTVYYDLAIPNDTTGDNYDTSRFKIPQMVFLYLFEPMPWTYALKVCALDTNYFDWVRGGVFGPGAGAGRTTRLTGGLGVFGAGVGESVEVYVREDTSGVGSIRRQESEQKPEVPGWLIPSRHALDAGGQRPAPVTRPDQASSVRFSPGRATPRPRPAVSLAPPVSG